MNRSERARSAMHVSFDIDDTLVCGASVPTEQHLPFWLRRRYPERVRRGFRSLALELRRRGCHIWVYTTSGRPSHYLAGWFRSMGVPLAGVVNQPRHEEVVGCRGPSKYPPAFGIGLHVDDSPGVAMEGAAHGFRVVVVAPEDERWHERVLQAVEALRSPLA
ncbi:MAG TPA: hypothetical protein VKE95_03130 [Burkholderiales bacterium]|nr:hypothetical protein [Burkholderiales bacterium]